MTSTNVPIGGDLETARLDALAETLGLALLTMRGQRLSIERSIKLIAIVTYPSFKPAPTRGKLYNVHTLREH